MTARDRAERVGPVTHRETERQRDAEQSDADVGKSGREDGAAAAAENEPERPKQFRRELEATAYSFAGPGTKMAALA